LPISRERKEELVERYVELLNGTNGFALVSSEGLTVPKVEELRSSIYEAGGDYMVTKNTLIRIALEQAGWAVPEGVLTGRTAIAFGNENFPGVAKALLDFIKENELDEKMHVKGGIMEGDQILTADEVKEISDLPTLPELQSQIIGLIVQPSRNIVTILQNAESGVVNVLQAWLDKNSGEGGDDEAA
jgi:large subunit ribosomal protein L10